MARLTKTEATRQLGIARATLYTLISQGKVSPAPDGLIDQAEVVRVAPYIDTLHDRLQTSTDTLVDILHAQLRLMQERAREHARLYEEREQAYREHIAPLTADRRIPGDRLSLAWTCCRNAQEGAPHYPVWLYCRCPLSCRDMEERLT